MPFVRGSLQAALGDAVRLDDTLARVALRFEQKLGRIAETNAVRQREEIPGLRDVEAPALWEANRRLTRDSRRAQAAHIAEGNRLESFPRPDVEAVHLAIRGGMSIPEVLHAYRIGHVITLEAWLEALGELDLPDGTRAEYAMSISRLVSDYDERLASLVAQECQREMERIRGHERQALLSNVRSMLEGTRDDLDSTYPMDLDHLGAVAWGSNASVALGMLAKSLDRRLFSVEADAGVMFGWLGGTYELGDRQAHALRRFSPPAGTCVSLGSPGRGPEGFRRTHRQAGDGHLIALRTGAPVTFYEQVALEALALSGNEANARAFVEEFLAGINGDDPTGTKLRATLTAYFGCQQNKVAAAARLGISDASIPRHLQRIEQLTGHRPEDYRAEFETALRLRAVLHPERPADGRTRPPGPVQSRTSQDAEPARLSDSR